MEVEVVRSIPVVPILAVLLIYWVGVVMVFRHRVRRAAARAIRAAAASSGQSPFAVNLRVPVGAVMLAMSLPLWLGLVLILLAR